MKYTLMIFLMAQIAGCTPNSSNTVAEKKFDINAVKAHIVKMNESYGKRFTSNDPVFYAERYCRDAVVMGANAPAVSGLDSIRSYFYNGGNSKDISIELPAGNFYGNEELVVEEGMYNFPDGKGGSIDKGKFIALWKQEEGKWKLYREIWNTDLAPPK